MPDFKDRSPSPSRAATPTLSKGFRILVPVNGTAASRRGAEIAFALSPARESTITALYVAERSNTRQTHGVAASPPCAVKPNAPFSKTPSRWPNVTAHDDMETAIHCETAPEDAIVEEAEYMAPI